MKNRENNLNRAGPTMARPCQAARHDRASMLGPPSLQHGIAFMHGDPMLTCCSLRPTPLAPTA